MKKDPHELAKRVVDEETFLEFTRSLLDDRLSSIAKEKKEESSPFGPEAGGWENRTIEDFLEAGIAWAEATEFGKRMAFKELELNEINPWTRVAAFLMAAKTYE